MLFLLEKSLKRGKMLIELVFIIELHAVICSGEVKQSRSVGSKELIATDILKVIGNLKLTLHGNPLDPTSADFQKKIAAHLYDGTVLKQAEIWSLMAKLDSMIALANNFTEENSKEICDIDGLVDGDMLFDKSDIQNVLDDFERNPDLMKLNTGTDIGKINVTDNMKWDMPIRYQINGLESKPIKEAIAVWEKETCIRFKEEDGQIKGPHIVFSSTKPGCWSKIGRKPNGQIINLSPRCQQVGFVIHEIGHAVGYLHEHTRTDRDSHVNIFLDNVLKDKKKNFARYPSNKVETYRLPYDYSSVMHYGIYTFSKTPGKLKTMTAKLPGYDRTLGQRITLSFYDAKAANYHYCSAKCSDGLLWSKCANDGYRNPTKCNECKCPDGWSGQFCTLPAESRPAPLSCGSTSLKANSKVKYLNSPGYYTHGYSNTDECSWVILAPPGKRVQFQFLNKFSIPCNGTCVDYVEVRYLNLNKAGPRFCCGRPSHVFKSTGQAMLINFRAFSGGQEKGFRAQYRYLSPCGKSHRRATSYVKNLTSPGYNTTKYSPPSTCTWEIFAPPGKRVQLQFQDNFDLKCNNPCIDYVEVRYSSFDIGSRSSDVFICLKQSSKSNFCRENRRQCRDK